MASKEKFIINNINQMRNCDLSLPQSDGKKMRVVAAQPNYLRWILNGLVGWLIGLFKLPRKESSDSILTGVMIFLLLEFLSD